MSKYSEKVEARRRNELAGAFRAVESRKDEAKAVQAKEPPKNVAAPRGQIANLGCLPEALSAKLQYAVAVLEDASALANDILAKCLPGIQTCEPRAICQFLRPTVRRIEAMSKRARVIPNQPQPETEVRV